MTTRAYAAARRTLTLVDKLYEINWGLVLLISLIACVGLYGTMPYTVARRTGEIGIRMALGAEQSRVLRMVLREVAILIGIGLAIGLGAAVATTRFVESFLYGMKPNDPWTLSLAAVALAVVAALCEENPATE